MIKNSTYKQECKSLIYIRNNISCNIRKELSDIKTINDKIMIKLIHEREII